MAKKTEADLKTNPDTSPVTPNGQAEPSVDDEKPRMPVSWYKFVSEATPTAIRIRFSEEAKDLIKRHEDTLASYVPVALMDPYRSISDFDTDRLFTALSHLNVSRQKDVLLVVLSTGGAIEPAYQISKLCKQYSKNRFVALVPRQAKSAATLIALGADEIHMGALGQLGPIDPQLGGLPALGVVQALKTIASLAEEYPASGEMFARYLRLALTVEQIGYCERIGESAVQYAERLLSTKPSLVNRASEIARELVYEYKDHSFVIDPEEAQQHLGPDWVKTDTKELEFAEDLYRLFEEVDLDLRIMKRKRLLVLGNPATDAMIFDLDNR